MAVGLTRASLFGVKKEVTLGLYIAPSVGKDILALRPGNELSYEPEILESDELLNDIGAAKGSTGKQAVSGKHSAYLRHSGVEGQEPQTGLFFESILGSKYIVAVEQSTIASSTVSRIKLGSGAGALCRVGQAVLIKDGVNGYSIRNISEIIGDDIILNFDLDNAPSSGVGLGKAVVYLPVAQGHPTFSTTKYLGNGYAKECSAGNTATGLSLKATANVFGELEFSYEGTDYLFNPIEIKASNKFIDFVDDAGTHVLSIPERFYKTPIELADAIEAAMNSLSVEDFTVKYSNKTGKFTFKTITSTVFSILWVTGANTANNMHLAIGFNNVDDTGATEYTSNNEQEYACPVTPDFDSGEKIVLKNVDLMIGDSSENICVCAQELTLDIGKEVEDVDCMCDESGIAEKIPTGRTAEMSATITLKKFDAALLDALLKNKTISAMMNAGHKLGGNWIAGQNFNFYLQNATVSKYTTKGDSFIQVDLALKGFVTSTKKDIYANFI